MSWFAERPSPHNEHELDWRRDKFAQEMGLTLDVVKHAGKYRTNPKEWLERMSAQVRDGKVTKEVIQAVAARFEKVIDYEAKPKAEAQEFIVWLKEAHPNLQDFYTNLHLGTMPYFFDESLRRQGNWLEGLNLNGLELDHLSGHEYFDGVDFSTVNLQKVNTIHREISLMEDALTIPKMARQLTQKPC